MNYTFITDNIAVGTYPEGSDDVAKLKRANITHVLNVREFDDIQLVKDSFEYLWNPTADWNPSVPFGGEPKPLEWFSESLGFWFSPVLVAPPVLPMLNRRIFVHCSEGINRSATTAWMFLRALQLKPDDCSEIVDNRLVAIFGTLFDRPWRNQAEAVLKLLGYVRG